MQVNEFVLDNVMNREVDSEGKPWWWAACVDGTESSYEGYVVLWANGVYHHTHQFPPDIWGDK